MCVSTAYQRQLSCVFPSLHVGARLISPSPSLLLRPAQDRGQSPPEVPDDRLTNVERLLPDLVNSLEDTAATGRPGRVVHRGFSVDGTTHSHCRRPGWLGKIYEERIQPVTGVIGRSVPV